MNLPENASICEELDGISTLVCLDFRCKHHFLNSLHSVVANFCENRFPNEGWLSEDFIFFAWIFVFQLALFCTSNVQLVKDVYNHRFWCQLKKQRYFLDVSAVCSELFAVLKLAVGLLNICTLNVMTVWKPETQFWCEFAREWLLQKILLLANMKQTWNFGLLSLRYSGSTDEAVTYFIYVWKFEFEKFFHVIFLKSQFFFQNGSGFKWRPNLRPFISPT